MGKERNLHAFVQDRSHDRGCGEWVRINEEGYAVRLLDDRYELIQTAMIGTNDMVKLNWLNPGWLMRGTYMRDAVKRVPGGHVDAESWGRPLWGILAFDSHGNGAWDALYGEDHMLQNWEFTLVNLPRPRIWERPGPGGNVWRPGR